MRANTAPIGDRELFLFVTESNRIEGIQREPTDAEIMAHVEFLTPTAYPSVAEMMALVAVCQPDAELRTRPGLNVRVGNHIAPRGGSGIAPALLGILAAAGMGEHPYKVHQAYENLHPFTDGNGRSGRALWLWQMLHQHNGAPLGFLHHWYYQSLEHGDGR